MKKLCCALIAASCVAQSVGAMQQPVPAVPAVQPQQVQSAPVAPQNNNQNQNVLGQAQQVSAQGAASAPAQQQAPAVIQPLQSQPANVQPMQPLLPSPSKKKSVGRCSCTDMLAKSKTSLAPACQKSKEFYAIVSKKVEELEKLVCDGDKRITLPLGSIAMALSYFAPSWITSSGVALLPAGIGVAAYELPAFRAKLKTHWHALIPFAVYLLGCSLYEHFLCEGVCSSKKISLAFCALAAVICLGKYLYHDCDFINDNPKKIFAGLVAFLALSCFLRSLELLPDSLFATFAIPSAGLASSLYFLKIRDAKPEKKSSEKKSESSKEKTDPSKKTV